MIGTHHFKHLLALLSVVCLPTMLLGRDVIEMTDGSILNGVVKSISSDGEMHLSSPLSAKNLRLSVEKLKSVNFASKSGQHDESSSRLILSNSDELPIKIESFNGSLLSFKSPDIGNAQVDRGGIESMKFVDPSPRLIYSGPLATDRWRLPNEHVAGWELQENILTTFQHASSIYNFEELPNQYGLQMTFSWQHEPNFEVRFGNSTNFSEPVSNQYLLSFRANGIELRRESNAPSRILSILYWQPQMNQLSEKQAKLELRVDRLQSRIYLRFNDERVAVGFDPLEKNPSGTGIMISGIGSSDNQLMVREIKLSEVNDARGPFAFAQSSNLERDCIVTRDDDRLSGRIESIQSTEQGLLFRFVSDFKNSPFELLDSDLCYVYFAKGDVAEGASQTTPFQKLRSFLSNDSAQDAKDDSTKTSLYKIGLSSGGKLSADVVRLSESSMEVEHSLLGKISIPRNRITWMTSSTNHEQAVESP